MATPPRKKRVGDARSARRSQPTVRLVPVADAEIARRAFELYVARGREDGRDIDDWLRAERELSTPKSVAAREARHAKDA